MRMSESHPYHAAAVKKAIRVMRTLFVACFASGFISLCFAVFQHGLTDELIQAYARAEPEWLAFDNPFESPYLLLEMVLVAVGIVGYVGLWQLKRWGRALALWSTLAAYVLAPISGPSLFGAWELMFYDVSTLLLGAALASAYMSPAAEAFLPASMTR